MHTIEPISEAEVVAIFLQAEIQSSRVQQRILSVLERDGVDRHIIDHPDLSDPHQNGYRAQVLGESRGYKHNYRLFSGFPDRIQWERAYLEQADFDRIKYINYPYWNELSQGTRMVAQAAAAIQNGIEADGRANRTFWEIVDALLARAVMPEIILVSRGHESDLIILEGAHRMTAHFLVPKAQQGQVQVIAGFSSQLVDWVFY